MQVWYSLVQIGPQSSIQRNNTMEIGVVKFFDEKKGYGFIAWRGHKDIFVHFSGILSAGFKTLKENDKVSFSVIDGPKGLPQADQVTLIKE